MRLLKLYLEDCGVFRNEAIDFTYKQQPLGMICISGVNGSGKTTVLEIIFQLAQFFYSKTSLRSLHFNQFRPNILTNCKFAQLDFLIEEKIVSIVFGDKAQRQKNTTYPQSFIIIKKDIKTSIKMYEDRISKLSPDDTENDTGITMLADVIKKDPAFDFNQWRELIDCEKISDLLLQIETSQFFYVDDELLKQLPSFFLFNAFDRKILDIRYNSVPYDKPKYKIAEQYFPRFNDLTKLLIYYDYAFQADFKKLKKWINTYILEGKELEGIDRVNFKVIINVNGSKHSIEWLSAGEESLLIIALHIYLKAFQHSIILIDEIDQSLHPEYLCRNCAYPLNRSGTIGCYRN